jgi:hypothetical protein
VKILRNQLALRTPLIVSSSVLPPASLSCSKSGRVEDEACIAGRPAASFPAPDEDYFRDMGGKIVLTSDTEPDVLSDSSRMEMME